MNTHTTLHGMERMKERHGVKNEKSVNKLVALASERGKRAEDCTSWERTYLYAHSCDSCVAIAYGEYCYIIGDNNICITIFRLPIWFGKKKQYVGKERIKNMKVYSRLNLCKEDAE